MGAFGILKKSIVFLYSAFLFITLFLLVVLGPKRDYYLKTEAALFDGKLLLEGLFISVIAMGIILIAAKILRLRELPEISPGKRSLVIVCLSILLFITEAVVFTRCFFFSDWDPAAVLDCVYKILHGAKDEISLDYFSAHQNNLTLVFIYAAVLRLAGFFGTESVLSLILFQSLLFTLSGVLLFKIAEESFSFKGAVISWLVFALWIGLNPWLIITYSDAVGLIFPLLTVRLFQLYNKNRGSRLIPCLMGVAAALGYAVKPQTAIVFIASLLILVSLLLFSWEKALIRPVMSSVLSFFLMLLIVEGILIPSLGLKLNNDKAFGFSHYLMMGLNTETDGVYSNEDTEFTNSIPDPGERRRTNLRVAGERLRSMGPAGLSGHLINKQLVNFNDGTFSWGIDGNFFSGTEFPGIPPLKENKFRSFIYTIIKPDGEYYGRFTRAEQLIWLTVLFFSFLEGVMVLCGIGGEEKGSYIEILMMLSVLGLMAFELIFEAKARYLFTFLPVFLLLAFSGVNRVFSFGCKGMKTLSP